jgi:hypothetical protein
MVFTAVALGAVKVMDVIKRFQKGMGFPDASQNFG